MALQLIFYGTVTLLSYASLDGRGAAFALKGWTPLILFVRDMPRFRGYCT